MKFAALSGPTKVAATTAQLIYTAPAPAGSSAQVKVNVQNIHASTAAKWWLMIGGSTDDYRITPKVLLASDESAIKKDIILSASQTLYFQTDTANIFTVTTWGVEHP